MGTDRVTFFAQAKCLRLAHRRGAAIFGRYWGHSGHRDALEPEGSVAIDP
jgi:hypothetical protein